jgi:hypothetical protein
MGYGMMEVHRYAGFTMTGMHRPMQATLLNIVREVVLLISLSIAGKLLWRIDGIFWGRLLTDDLAGRVGFWWSGRMLEKAKGGRCVLEATLYTASLF